MKNFEKDYNKLRYNNNKLFDFQSEKEKPNQIQIENEWSKIESLLQKSRLDDCFIKEDKENNNINDSMVSLNIGANKSLDWEDFENSNRLLNSQTKNDNYNNNQDFSPKKSEETDMDLYLKKFIHPIDNEFDLFIKKKIEDFEKMKTNYKKKDNTISNNTNNNLKKNRIIKNKIENINNLLGIKKITGEKSVIKEKNNTNFFFGGKFNRRKIEDSEDDDDYIGLKKRSYLFEKNGNKNLVLDNMKKNKSMIFSKDNKQNSGIVNGPNKINILLNSKNSNEESGLEKIKNICFDCIRGQKDELNENGSNNKDYFKTILYELNWKK